MSGLQVNLAVVPFDFSDESKAAVDAALEIAGAAARIRIIHVLFDLTAAAPGAVLQNIDDDERVERARQAVQEQFTDEEYREVQVEILVGDPGFRIAEFAEKIGADLIVIPSQGRTGLALMLVGSVAERVVRQASCRVLVLKNDPD